MCLKPEHRIIRQDKYRYRKPLLTLSWLGWYGNCPEFFSGIACTVACCIMSSLLCSSPGSSGSRRSLWIAPELGLPLGCLPGLCRHMARCRHVLQLLTATNCDYQDGRNKKSNVCLVSLHRAAFRALVPSWICPNGNFGPNKRLTVTPSGFHHSGNILNKYPVRS
jgi:hypothetical protein